jgi:hypothetical protein
MLVIDMTARACSTSLQPVSLARPRRRVTSSSSSAVCCRDEVRLLVAVGEDRVEVVDLAQRGICVISGIDAHAHRAALAGSQGKGQATIAVLAEALTGTTRPETQTLRPRSAPTA